MVTDDENELLVAAFRQLSRGAGLVARHQRKNVGEIELSLPLTAPAAKSLVRRVLSAQGHLLAAPIATAPTASGLTAPGPTASGLTAAGPTAPGPTAADPVTAGAAYERAILGSGTWNLHPAVVTVCFDGGDGGTTLTVRGVACEGLIRQRAGEAAARRIAQLITAAARR